MLRTTALLTVLLFGTGLQLGAKAENFAHLSQLLSTKQCVGCDLSRSGLVQADLVGADLRGANLVGANLSQADLTGADLSGANLTQTSLYGANLTGVNLTGAITIGTDFRRAYLYNANVAGLDLGGAHIDDVQGLSQDAGSPEQFVRWGMAEAKERDYDAAIAHFERAMIADPDFAPAYLARGLAHYRTGNPIVAERDAQMAADLYAMQDDVEGQAAAENFIVSMGEAEEAYAKAQRNGSGNFGNLFMGVASMALKVLGQGFGIGL
ncbi:MAG: pentapeptide repeat-containing protein [Cyanobacteria bacterium P01_H01_bin.15]